MDLIYDALAEGSTALTLQVQQKVRSAIAVRHHPGLTSNELARISRLDRYMLARRLPELAREGRVWRGANKFCLVSGRMACTWWPMAPSAAERTGDLT